MDITAPSISVVLFRIYCDDLNTGKGHEVSVKILRTDAYCASTVQISRNKSVY